MSGCTRKLDTSRNLYEVRHFLREDTVRILASIWTGSMATSRIHG